MRSVHQAVLAVAVTGFVAAVRHRSSTSRATMPRATGTTRTTRPTRTTRSSGAASSRRKATVPAQRRSEIEQLGLGVEELVVAEHEAQDARLFDALEWSGG